MRVGLDLQWRVSSVCSCMPDGMSRLDRPLHRRSGYVYATKEHNGQVTIRSAHCQMTGLGRAGSIGFGSRCVFRRM